MKEGKAKQERELLLSGDQALIHLYFCMGSGHEGLILAKRMPQYQKNPEFLNHQGKITGCQRNNLGDLLVQSPELTGGSTAMQKGSGKRPEIQPVDSPVDTQSPISVAPQCFFFFNYINLSQRKFHETL